MKHIYIFLILTASLMAGSITTQAQTFEQRSVTSVRVADEQRRLQVADSIYRMHDAREAETKKTLKDAERELKQAQNKYKEAKAAHKATSDAAKHAKKAYKMEEKAIKSREKADKQAMKASDN